MNVKTMLADFLAFVTPKTMHKARFSVLLDAVTAPAKDPRCNVTAIGRAMVWAKEWNWKSIKSVSC